jgi:hypothetical protein
MLNEMSKKPYDLEWARQQVQTFLPALVTVSSATCNDKGMCAGEDSIWWPCWESILISTEKEIKKEEDNRISGLVSSPKSKILEI